MKPLATNKPFSSTAFTTNARSRSFDCGGADEMAEVTSDYFDCGETYYWRVFAYAGNRSGHSEVASFEMDCPNP